MANSLSMISATDLLETVIKAEEVSDEETGRQWNRAQTNGGRHSVSSDEEIDVTDATMADMTTNYHDSRLPMLDDFPGPYNFTYQLPPENNRTFKPTWEYSASYRQVFIKMGRVLVVQFNFDRRTETPGEELYIRAVLVYASSDHVYSPVNRCALHTVEDDPMSRSHADPGRCYCPQYQLAGHVVRCKSMDAIYCFDPKSQRHSVLCPVQTATDILYSFVCKNSCPKGMHRRHTKLVFTLENSTGEMLGRSSLDVKISTCPRRDCEKLEKGFKGAIEAGVVLSGSPDRSDDEDNDRGSNDNDVIVLPGEVIMKLRSEVRNIRQALQVIERRVDSIQDLVTTS